MPRGSYFKWRDWIHLIPEETWAILSEEDRLKAVKRLLKDNGADAAKVDAVSASSMRSAYSVHLADQVKSRIEARRQKAAAENAANSRKRGEKWKFRSHTSVTHSQVTRRQKSCV